MFSKKRSTIQLHWEWPDGRNAEQQVHVRVVSIRAEPGGLFGFKKSPSFIGGLQDRQVLSGIVVAAGGDTEGKDVRLVLPKKEVSSILPGDTILLDIVDSDTCIAVKKSQLSQ